MKSKTQKLVICLVSSWLVVFGVLPLLLLVGASFLVQDPLDFFKLGFSLDAYRRLADSAYLEVVLRSVKLAAVTTALCLAAGYPFAWFTVRLSRSSRIMVLILLMIPFWTNSLVRTYAIRLVLGTQG
jgi:spermidine/putrescine transport system permease protein